MNTFRGSNSLIFILLYFSITNKGKTFCSPRSEFFMRRQILFFNSFLNSGIVHPNYLDASISSFRGFWWMFHFYCILHTLVNSVDPDTTLHFAICTVCNVPKTDFQSKKGSSWALFSAKTLQNGKLSPFEHMAWLCASSRLESYILVYLLFNYQKQTTKFSTAKYKKNLIQAISYLKTRGQTV